MTTLPRSIARVNLALGCSCAVTASGCDRAAAVSLINRYLVHLRRHPPHRHQRQRKQTGLVELALWALRAENHRLGVDFVFRALEDSWLTSTVERQRTAPWGLAGGGEGRPNSVLLTLPDGTEHALGKKTRVPVPKGARVELRTGGGGGYGSAAERDADAVRDDLRKGYVTEEHARRFYPDAVD
jgi:Hydantoinase B/oxoprolinase